MTPDTTAAPVRIVIADDHRFVRSGLRLLLGEEPGMEVVGEARDAGGALRLVGELAPDVLLLDLDMPGYPGLEAIPEVAALDGATRVVILAMQADPGFASRALAAGASAFVLKEAADGELEHAIRAAAAGETYVSPRTDGGAALTARELEVLRLIALGHANDESSRSRRRRRRPAGRRSPRRRR